MNAELLSDIEGCERRAYWSQSFKPIKLHPTEILRRVIAEALVDPDREDRGENAGELYMALCAKGLDTAVSRKYDVAVHHACLADILTTYLASRGSYTRPKPVVGVNFTWDPWCLQRGGELVRVVLVDHWSDEREASEARSWWTLAEMAAYKLPMNLEIIMLGASSGGKRHSFWTKGLLHCRNRQLRFVKHAKKAEGFTDSWIPVAREEYDQISRDEWLAAMEADGAIAELTRRKHIDAFQQERIKELRSLIERKTERLYKIDSVPDPNYSNCSWPRPCPYQSVCFGNSPSLGPTLSLGFRRREVT